MDKVKDSQARIYDFDSFKKTMEQVSVKEKRKAGILKDLLADTTGSIEHAFSEAPPRVEYDLTENGKEILDVLTTIKTLSERMPEHELHSKRKTLLSKVRDSLIYMCWRSKFNELVSIHTN